MGTGEVREGRGVDSSRYHEVPLSATAAGSLIWAIYTPVRSVQVPTNHAVQKYPPDASFVHKWPTLCSLVHTHPCTETNVNQCCLQQPTPP